MLLLEQRDRELGQALDPLLNEVGRRFAAELESDLACVNLLVEHVERYRGKMLRPTLLLVSAMASRGGHDLGDLRKPALVAATVCEMVHMATLVHDDILDEADLRRRGQTVNSLQGNETAVMLGDYLISHAYHLCSSLGRADISRAVASATNTVCEGELLQLSNRQNWDLDELTYYEIIRRKTASLCGLCCELPTILSAPAESAGGQREVGEALHTYGQKLGLAFQIVDDLLDLTGDEQTVGKSLGRDLAKGKLTLPMILYLENADPAKGAAMRKRLSQCAADAERGGVLNTEDFEQIASVLQASDVLQQSRDQARRLVDQSVSCIESALPDSPARRMLAAMAHAVITRQS